MGALVAGEGDDDFWNQEALKDARAVIVCECAFHSIDAVSQEAADVEYASEKEEADVFDSDFNESEAWERTETRKRGD